jgi:hypothetical protein
MDTPDGRYSVVRGRLWRATNHAERRELRNEVDRLKRARRARSLVVDGWKPRLQPQVGEEHALRRMVRGFANTVERPPGQEGWRRVVHTIARTFFSGSK